MYTSDKLNPTPQGTTTGSTVPTADTSGDKVTSAAQPAVERIASGAHQAVDAAADMATQAVQSLETKAAQLKDWHTQLLGTCSGYVRDHPMASIGIAFGTGFLLSRLLRSR